MYSHQTQHTSLTPPTTTLISLSSSLTLNMLDLQQGLPRNRLNFFFQSGQSIDQMALVQADFEFWGEQRTQAYDGYGCSGYAGDVVDFQAQTLYDDACSPQAFRMSKTPLLPCNHQYSYLTSPKSSRLQAIIDGRRELMEMIQDMPESWYELSLKDIVDEQHVFQADQKEIVGIDDEKSLNFKPQHKMKQQKKTKKKNCRRGQISRSESMDCRVFRLKMFFPISLGLKRKSTAGNRSKVSPRPSLDRSGPGSEKTRVDKEWWKMRFLSMGEGKNRGRSSITGSTSSSSTRSTSSSSKSREDDINFIPGCWPFHKKYRSSRQKECLL